MKAQTDRDNTGDLINYPMLCCSNGTDNKLITCLYHCRSVSLQSIIIYSSF